MAVVILVVALVLVVVPALVVALVLVVVVAFVLVVRVPLVVLFSVRVGGGGLRGGIRCRDWVRDRREDLGRRGLGRGPPWMPWQGSRGRRWTPRCSPAAPWRLRG